MPDDSTQFLRPQPDGATKRTVLEALGGADRVEAPASTSYDRSIISSFGLLTLVAYLPTFLIWSTVFVAIFGRSIDISPLRMACGCLVAFVIVALLFAYDRTELLTAWCTEGRRSLIARKVLSDPQASFWERLRWQLCTAVRLLLPVVNAISGATLCMAVLFGDSAAMWQRQQYALRNVAVYKSAEEHVAERIKHERDEIAKSLNEESRFSDERQTLVRGSLGNTPLERELSTVSEERIRLRGRRQKAQQEANEAEANMVAERNGIRLSEQHSGRPGNGPRAQFHTERVTQARAEEKRLTDDLNGIEQQLETLLKQVQDQRAAHQRVNSQRIEQYDEWIRGTRDRRAAAEQRLREFTANRATLVREHASQRPEYRPFTGDIWSDVDALYAITFETWPRLLVFICIKLFLVFTEMLMPLRILAMPHTNFGTRLALAQEREMRRASYECFEQEFAQRLHETVWTAGKKT